MYIDLKTYLHKEFNVSNNDWALLLAISEEKQYTKGSLILKEGELCEYIYCILSGLTIIYFRHKGKQYTRQFFVENSIFTEFMSLTTHTPSKSIIEAIEETKLLALPINTFLEHAQTHPSFMSIYKSISERISIEGIKKNMDIVSKNALDRYIDLLTQRPEIIRRVPQHYIASYLGITPESLSRIRKNYKNKSNS